MSTFKKPAFFLTAAALVVCAGLLVWTFYGTPSNDGEVVLHGNVDIRQVSLAFEGSQRIAELRVQEGDQVKAGQVLGRLDLLTLSLREEQAKAQVAVQEQLLAKLKNGSRPQEVAEAQSRVRSAEADLQLATQHLKRLEATSAATEGQGVSTLELDTAQARLRSTQAQLEAVRKSTELVVQGPRKEDIQQAEAQLQSARAELALTQRNLQEGELKSPVDGVVRARLMEPGDMASPQKTVYTLAITHPKWIRAYVSGQDLSRVKAGQTAQVIATGSETGVPGTVGYISSVAEFTPKTVQTEELRTSLVYEVRVNVEDKNDALRLGQPVTVHLPRAAQQ